MNFYQYPTESPAPQSTLTRRLFQGAFDFIGILFCLVLFAIIYFAVDPRIQYYTCDMSDVSFPKANDTVEIYVVALYGILAPIVIIILVEFYNANLFCWQNKQKTDRRGRFRKFGICIFHGLSLFAFGLAMVLLLTEIGKRTVGRLRPHFLAVCKPNLAAIDCVETTASGSIYKAIYTGGSFCTGDKDEIEEARLSFPSGHSSFSAFAMLFVIIFLEARFFQMETRFIKVLLQMGAFIATYYTGMSRLVDYAHRGSDIIGGAVLGAIIALLMTLIVGKVLWVYDRRNDYKDADLRQIKKQEQFQRSQQMGYY